jgi:hypothetical protein
VASALQTFGMLPGGRSIELKWPDFTRYLRTEYLFKEDEKNRKAKCARRQRFYMSGGDMDMANFIMSVVEDPTVREKRLEFIEHSKFNNVLRRVVHELATVYAMPARRTVAGNDNNARYQEVQRRSRQHEVMLRVNRLAILQRNLAIGPRVQEVNGTKQPVLDVVTPDCFSAVPHPLDPTVMGALVLDVAMAPVSGAAPRWVAWTAGEYLYLNAAGEMIGDPVPHSYGRIPWILFSIEPPAGCLLDTTTGDDLEAAHRAVWFLDLLLLKEAKSATKQHVIRGDLSRAVREQAADTDVPMEVPEGVDVNTIDNSMDLDMYVQTARAVYETAAANYGLPPSVLRHDGAQSAEARELQRVPLREIRLQQQIPFRDLERELAELQALVIGSAIPELKFTTDGWSVDFADPQTPLGTKEQLEVFEHERRLTMNSTIAELMRRNPDLDRDQAVEVMKQYIADETERNVEMRPLQVIAGTPGATTPQVATADNPDDEPPPAAPMQEAA